MRVLTVRLGDGFSQRDLEASDLAFREVDEGEFIIEKIRNRFLLENEIGMSVGEINSKKIDEVTMAKYIDFLNSVEEKRKFKEIRDKSFCENEEFTFSVEGMILGGMK